MTAGIAFYGVLALVPTLVATVSIYGLVNQGNEAEIKEQIEDAAGSLDVATKAFVTKQLTDITTSAGTTVALAIGIVVALFSASGAAQKLMGSVALAYEADEDRPGWKVRALAYLFTLGAIVGVVLMVTVVGVVPAVLSAVDLGGPVEATIAIGQFPAFAALLAGGLTVLYRYGPDRREKTPWRNRGAVAATVLWVMLAIAFSAYSSNVGAMPASYGLLGAVAALMVFLQLTALCVVVGAEVNAETELRLHPDQAAVVAPPGTEPARPPVEPVGLGKALLGLVALFLLGGGRR
jgi:membrane protein